MDKTTNIEPPQILAPGVSEAVFDSLGPEDGDDRLSEMTVAALIASNAARVLRGERRMRDGATPVSVITDAANDVSGIGVYKDAEDSAYRRATLVRLYVEGRLLDEPVNTVLGNDGRFLPWRGLDEWALERGHDSFAQIAVELDEIAVAICEGAEGQE